ncbi:helical backbone metal receptor [Terrabacter sp. NPDC080008]|uniref:helical backbone metal receptor n=1 Tax=Terrabacter sp. NPDC080008 TaxID=3155176 RepID=UPI00344FA365
MPPVTLEDDLAYAVSFPSPPRRVVSLVPSITEALAATCIDRLVGATDWCTHPSELAVQRVRGTKNPDRAAIAGLRPDLVVANKEENRELDVQRLRADGIPVWVTDIETVPAALDSLERLFVEVLDVGTPAWLAQARDEWGGPLPEPSLEVAVAIWCDPWMAVGRDTFTGDVVARLGWRNVLADAPERYPHVDLADLDREGVTVLLPDEPYVFTPDDGPEAFARARTALVSGRLLTWYGPSLVGARAALTAAVTG